MPTIRPASWLLLLAMGVVALAVASAFAVDRVGLGPAALPPLAAATVVAIVFWRRPTVGLLSFGLFTLLAETFEHWLSLDLLLFDELGLLLLVGATVAGRHAIVSRIRLGWIEASMVVLALAGLLSSLANGVPLMTWTSGLYLLFKGIAFFALVRLLPVTVPQAMQLGVAMLFVATAIGGLGAIEWLAPTAFQDALGLPRYELARGDVPIVKSIFLHPAQYGWLTAFAALLCAARFSTHRSWWALPAGLAFSLGTFVSGRRTPILGMVAAIAVGLTVVTRWMGMRRATVQLWAPAALVVVTVALVGGASLRQLAVITAFEYGPSLDHAGEIFADDPRPEVVANVHPRVALYAGSLAIAIDEFPLGGGVGRFGSHLSREVYSPLYEQYALDQVALLGPGRAQAATDAFWPMVLGETGAIGLVAALLLFLGISLTLWRDASTEQSVDRRLILLGALFVTIEGLVRSVTSSVYVAPPIGYFVLGTAAIAFATRLTGLEALTMADGLRAQDGNSTTRASTIPADD